mmetsp:Transcript_110690/g.352537  ORF Transcript_110690/g.352537 Transcript_110690/m.352537 type:complete len:959 (+) Transcript_110690:318-3194(+)
MAPVGWSADSFPPHTRTTSRASSRASATRCLSRLDERGGGGGGWASPTELVELQASVAAAAATVNVPLPLSARLQHSGGSSPSRARTSSLLGKAPLLGGWCSELPTSWHGSRLVDFQAQVADDGQSPLPWSRLDPISAPSSARQGCPGVSRKAPAPELDLDSSTSLQSALPASPFPTRAARPRSTALEEGADARLLAVLDAIEGEGGDERAWSSQACDSLRREAAMRSTLVHPLTLMPEIAVRTLSSPISSKLPHGVREAVMGQMHAIFSSHTFLDRDVHIGVIRPPPPEAADAAAEALAFGRSGSPHGGPLGRSGSPEGDRQYQQSGRASDLFPRFQAYVLGRNCPRSCCCNSAVLAFFDVALGLAVLCTGSTCLKPALHVARFPPDVRARLWGHWARLNGGVLPRPTKPIMGPWLSEAPLLMAPTSEGHTPLYLVPLGVRHTVDAEASGDFVHEWETEDEGTSKAQEECEAQHAPQRMEAPEKEGEGEEGIGGLNTRLRSLSKERAQEGEVEEGEVGERGAMRISDGTAALLKAIRSHLTSSGTLLEELLDEPSRSDWVVVCPAGGQGSDAFDAATLHSALADYFGLEVPAEDCGRLVAEIEDMPRSGLFTLRGLSRALDLVATTPSAASDEPATAERATAQAEDVALAAAMESEASLAWVSEEGPDELQEQSIVGELLSEMGGRRPRLRAHPTWDDDRFDEEVATTNKASTQPPLVSEDGARSSATHDGAGDGRSFSAPPSAPFSAAAHHAPSATGASHSTKLSDGSPTAPSNPGRAPPLRSNAAQALHRQQQTAAAVARGFDPSGNRVAVSTTGQGSNRWRYLPPPQRARPVSKKEMFAFPSVSLVVQRPPAIEMPNRCKSPRSPSKAAAAAGRRSEETSRSATPQSATWRSSGTSHGKRGAGWWSEGGSSATSTASAGRPHSSMGGFLAAGAGAAVDVKLPTRPQSSLASMPY